MPARRLVLTHRHMIAELAKMRGAPQITIPLMDSWRLHLFLLTICLPFVMTWWTSSYDTASYTFLLHYSHLYRVVKHLRNMCIISVSTFLTAYLFFLFGCNKLIIRIIFETSGGKSSKHCHFSLKVSPLFFFKCRPLLLLSSTKKWAKLKAHPWMAVNAK